MECLKNLTPDGLRQHLETLGFHFGPPDNHGRHDQYGYWMATIPGCGHTGQQSPATSNTAEHGFTLRQQEQPGVIRTACRTCLQETLVTLPETMSMRGSRPPGPIRPRTLDRGLQRPPRPSDQHDTLHPHPRLRPQPGHPELGHLLREGLLQRRPHHAAPPDARRVPRGLVPRLRTRHRREKVRRGVPYRRHDGGGNRPPSHRAS